MSRFLCWVFGHQLLFVRRAFGSWEIFRCMKCPAVVAQHAGTGVVLDYNKDVAEIERIWKEERDENFDDFTG